uniref:Cystatin domain-containing protein n=1 Tax=Leptobrachium leishanense TaxID=445787 RepID=A0A8C5QRY7_9ANUR
LPCGLIQMTFRGLRLLFVSTQVKPQVETKDGRQFQYFQAVSFASQIVAGTNYFVKVDVGQGECLHLRIYQNLDGQLLLSAYQRGKTQSSPLTYF